MGNLFFLYLFFLFLDAELDLDTFGLAKKTKKLSNIGARYYTY